MAQKSIFSRLFLVGILAGLVTLGLANFYAEHKIVVKVSVATYGVGFAVVAVFSLLLSLMLSSNHARSSTGLEIDEEQTNHAKHSKQVEELTQLLAAKELEVLNLEASQTKSAADFAEKKEQLEYQIARRNQIQGTLEANEQRFRGMIEGTSDTLLLASAAGVIEYISPAGEKLFGAEAEAYLGSEFDFVVPTDKPMVKEFLLKSDPNLSLVYRVQFRQKGGQVTDKFVSHRLSFLDIPGKRRVVIHSLRDVTAIKDAEAQKVDFERQLFHASKLASLGTMGAGIAHELNNPLTVVKGFTEKLRSDLKPVLGEAHPSLVVLEKILKQVTRMRSIVDQLRVFSRKDSTSEFVAIGVDRVINDALELQRHQLSGSMIDLHIELPEQIPTIKAHPTHFESVIQNLVSNAYDAHLARLGPAGPSRSYEPFIRLKVTTQQAKRMVHILVEDNAGGIPPEALNKIFDPFFTTKGPGKGTGLGLALVQSIVANHRGLIQVSTDEGVGTSFRIQLPMDADEMQPLAQQSAS